MKRKIALSLVALLGASAFAGGGHSDLYATKGCQQEYNGYWGFGAGWNRDNSEFKVEEYDVATQSSARVSAKENKSAGVGHFFLGYSFYNDMPYSVAVEAGMYTSGKKVSTTKMVQGSAGVEVSGTAKISAERRPAYYLALKPRYASGDWWVNLTLGAAASTYRVKSDFYNAPTVATSNSSTLEAGTSDGVATYGYMLGAGVGMWFNPSWAVSLDYDYMNMRKESSKTFKNYSAGAVTSYYKSAIKDGTSSHFVTLNLKNNFNWFA
tara:strand:- start:6130 stop:6927 length:798 start_codon:yes stop_codon:yes gene_type:complete